MTYEPEYQQVDRKARYDALPPAERARVGVIPIGLDAMMDAALRYRPKNKAKSLKPKKRRKAK
jgi:hypothetical protein